MKQVHANKHRSEEQWNRDRRSQGAGFSRHVLFAPVVRMECLVNGNGSAALLVLLGLESQFAEGAFILRQVLAQDVE